MEQEQKVPKVSFITPCYNDAKFISRFVDSIKDQDYTDWEMIIVNDGSTDGSKEIIDALAEGDARIHSMHLPENKGVCNVCAHLLRLTHQ